MKYVLPILTVLLLSIVSHAQDATTQRSEDPSLCECVKYAKTDPDLLSRCDQKFDFDYMSPGERFRTKELIDRCQDPQPCDCIERSDDLALMERCEEVFDTTLMDSTELSDYNNSIENCIVFNEELDIKDVCECVNGDPEDLQLQEECKELYDVSKMTESEREEFISMIDQCTEFKDDPAFLLTICDCISVKKDDLETMELCAEKFTVTELSEEERSAIYQEAKECFKIDNIDISDYCDCFTGKSTGPSCDKLLKALEKKFENAPEEIQQDFVLRLMDCFEGR